MCFKRIIDGCFDLLFPQRCQVCDVALPETERGAMVSKFCFDCCAGFELVVKPFCRVCGAELYGDKEKGPLCGRCLKSSPPFAICRSLFRYGGEIQSLVHSLKYKKDSSVLTGIAELTGGIELSEFSACDLIVPVPLHIKRLRQRGFNQAALLALTIFGEGKKQVVPDLLCRTRNTVPQTSLDGLSRRKSLKGAFTVKRGDNIKGGVICLVDDVYTTGTTVAECSKTLILHGAASVKVLTLARAELSPRAK
ncbi:MAG: ComF family protein [Desulfobulbaceae bacterium]|nr:ComF family protein [Desulfobulbaceae bacterium]